MTDQTPKAVFVIFGATGDLANRKLYQYLYRLYLNKKLYYDFAVVEVVKRLLTNDDFRNNIKQSIQEINDDYTDHEKFAEHFYYNPFDAEHLEEYKKLNEVINRLDRKSVV